MTLINQEGGKMQASYDLIAWQWDEENDLKNFPVWVTDVVHDQPQPPLMLYAWCYHHGLAFFYANEIHSIPECRGWVWRIVDGWPRLSLLEPKPEEVEERTRVFRERMAPIIDNHEEMFNKDMSKMLELYKSFKEADIEKVSDIELKRLFEDVWLVHKRQWEVHFYWMFFYYTIYLLFPKRVRSCLDSMSTTPRLRS